MKVQSNFSLFFFFFHSSPHRPCPPCPPPPPAQRGSLYLSNLSRQGGHGNSETLLELLASFFALEATLCGPEAWGHPAPAAAQ